MSTQHGTWQSMESAPKDTDILILTEATVSTGMRRSVEMGRYADDRHAKKPKPYWEQISRRHLGLVFMRKNPPIAWMPLPSTEFEPSKQFSEPNGHTAESILSFHVEMGGESVDETFRLGRLLSMTTEEIEALTKDKLDELIRPAFDDWQGSHVAGGWEIE